jgi:hypothetical protein
VRAASATKRLAPHALAHGGCAAAEGAAQRFVVKFCRRKANVDTAVDHSVQLRSLAGFAVAAALIDLNHLLSLVCICG